MSIGNPSAPSFGPDKKNNIKVEKVENFEKKENTESLSKVNDDGLTIFGTPKESLYIKEDIHND